MLQTLVFLSFYKRVLVVLMLVNLVNTHVKGVTINMTTSTATTTVYNGDVFQDNGAGATDYPVNADDIHTLTANTGCISLTFTSFDLEDGYDYLFVFDGTSTTANLIGVYSGSAPGTITGMTGSLTFVLNSDGATTADGWNANITTGATCATYNPFIGSHGGDTKGYVTRSCSGTLYDGGGDGGSSTSGSLLNYGNSQLDILTINTGAGTTVNMVFSSFALENCACDYLYGYNGTSTTAAATTSSPYRTGGNLPPNPVSANSGALTLRFTSDASTNKAGYVATWTSTVQSAAAISGSNSVIAGTSGVVYSTTAVNNAASYNWAVPAGASITAGQGTTSITVTFGSSSGNVSVTPRSACNVDGTASSLAVTVTTPAFRAGFSGMSIGATNWCPGETRNISVTVTNTGTAAWTDSGPDVNIGVKWDGEADYFVRVDAGGLAASAGQTYNFTVTAPATAGSQHLTFDVVNEGNCWFANNSGGCGPGNTVYASALLNIANSLDGGTIGSSQTICSGGDAAAFTNTASPTGGTGAWSYDWEYQDNCSGGWNSLAQNALTYDPPAGLTQNRCYRRKASNSCGVTYSNIVTVTVNADPIATGPTGGTICDGNTHDMTVSPSGGTGTFSYQWQQMATNCATASNVGSDASDYTTDPLTVGSYYYRCIIAQSGSGCDVITTSCATVTVSAPMNGGSITADQTICSAGDPASFASAADPTGGFGSWTYDWEYQDNCSGSWTIIGSNSLTYDPASGLTSTRCYRRSAANSCSAAYSNIITVSVSAALSGGTIASNQTICEGGDPASFTNSVSPSGGNGTWSYNWQYRTGCSGGWTNLGINALTYDPASGLSATTCYRRSATNSCGTAYSNSRTVTVQTFSIAATAVIADVNPSPIGNPVTLTFSGGSLGTNATWEWYSSSCGGTPIGSGTSLLVYPETATDYYVRAEGVCNSTTCAQLSVGTTNFSQGISNNGCNIIIQSGAYMYFDGDGSGDFINMSYGASTHGTIDIDGTMIIEGDWTNNAIAGNVFANVEATPNGSIQFKGTTTQTINGSDYTYFENVEIDNAATPALSLNTHLVTSGAATFTDGVVSTGGNRFIMSNTAPGNIPAASNASFVNGNFRRYIDVTGVVTGTYPFPVGDGTATANYKRVDLINTSLTGVSYIDVSVNTISESGSNVESNLATSQDGTDITEVMESAEWLIVPNTDPGGNYGVSLYLENTGVTVADDDKFCVLKRQNTSTNYADWSTLDGTTSIPAAGMPGRVYNGGLGYAQRTGYTSFSRFGVGRAPNVLPIVLQDMGLECNGTTRTIWWVTSSETDNSHFVISRACENYQFEPIGTVMGSGTTGIGSTYYYSDDQAPSDHCIYRIMQTDFNGESAMVGQMSARCETEQQVSDMITFPNPAADDLMIMYHSMQLGSVVCRLVDATGRICKFISTSAQVGDNVITIDVSGLANGLYTVVLDNGADTHTERIIKQR